LKERIFLSPPHMGGEEIRFVREAFESNYIAPLGPMVDALEHEFAEYTDIEHCAAVSSGTAAMHLALRCLGVGPGDEVFASTLTFIGSVTPIVFQGAVPVFIDSERESWNMDPDLLEAELDRCAAAGKLPKAVVPTDLYGQCCNLPRILEVCAEYDVPVVCDSAEAAGARYRGGKGERTGGSTDGGREKEEKKNPLARSEVHRGHDGASESAVSWLHAGKGAKAAVFSFNGNKIITTSGGGMLASDDRELIDYARKLSQQAREPAPHYEHREIGYNYRMSNIAAAIGRGQLRVIEERVRRRREIFEVYRQGLADLPGIQFMPEPHWSRSNRWLTVILIDPKEFAADREAIRLALEKENIESRPVWKPMHLQPVFGGNAGNIPPREDKSRDCSNRRIYPCRVVGGPVAEELFEKGLCLPSGTAMTDEDLERVIEVLRGCFRM